MKTIIILGMHRSATSMTARTLHKSSEVYMGKNLLKGLNDNPEGHYEDKAFLKLNIEILKAAGGDWANPPSLQSILNVRHKFDKRIEELVKQSEKNAKELGYKSWGFKDPRTVLTIDLYMKYIKKPQFICCYRDPYEIAESLSKRNNFSIERGINLAKTYNNRMNNFINNWLQNGKK